MQQPAESYGRECRMVRSSFVHSIRHYAQSALTINQIRMIVRGLTCVGCARDSRQDQEGNSHDYVGRMNGRAASQGAGIVPQDKGTRARHLVCTRTPTPKFGQ